MRNRGQRSQNRDSQSAGCPNSGSPVQKEQDLADEDLLTYPGFCVSFLVPLRHDPNTLESAIAEITRDVIDSAQRHLPPDCKVELQDTV